MTALAGNGQKIFMVAIPALHPGKAMLQVSAFQVAVNDLLKVGPPEPVWPFESVLVDLNKVYVYFLNFLLITTSPINPEPRRSMVAASGIVSIDTSSMY